MYYPEDPEKKVTEQQTPETDNLSEEEKNVPEEQPAEENEQPAEEKEQPAEEKEQTIHDETPNDIEVDDFKDVSDEREPENVSEPTPSYTQAPKIEAPAPKKKSGVTVTAPAIAVLLVCLVVFAIVIGVGVFKITQLQSSQTAEPTTVVSPTEGGETNQPSQSTPATEPTQTAAPAPTGDAELSGAQISPESTRTSVTSTPETDIISKCYSSVVAIDLYIGTTRAGSGAGIIYTTDGYILTNYHVVGSNASAYTVQVTLADGSKYEAKFVCGDMETDVSVIKIDKNDCVPATLGNSDTTVIGEKIYAIGNPNGEGISVTDGRVSALGRSGTVRSTNVTVFLTDQILISAPINGGNSGGGLFNEKGELIGIVNAKKYTDLSGNSIDGMGYAIPISKAIKSIDTLVENDGYIPGRAKLGVVVNTSGKTISSGWNVVSYTAVVTSVNAGSPAEAAGIKEGDIIIALGKNNLQQYTSSNGLLNDYDALHALLLNYKTGDSTTISVLRPETTTNIYGYQTTTYNQVDLEITFTDFNYSK